MKQNSPDTPIVSSSTQGSAMLVYASNAALSSTWPTSILRKASMLLTHVNSFAMNMPSSRTLLNRRQPRIHIGGQFPPLFIHPCCSINILVDKSPLLQFLSKLKPTHSSHIAFMFKLFFSHLCHSFTSKAPRQDHEKTPMSEE